MDKARRAEIARLKHIKHGTYNLLKMESLFYNCIGDVDKYQTGDLLTARVKSLPFIFHKGLIVLEYEQVYVWHNTPMYKNQFGGSVIKETLQDWLKSRTAAQAAKERGDVFNNFQTELSNENEK